MDRQQRVAGFVATHGIEAPPAYRLLDLVAEVGELAKEAAVSTDYGGDPAGVDLSEDELGDALFALLALCAERGVDADAALETSLAKYEERLDASGDPGSGG